MAYAMLIAIALGYAAAAILGLRSSRSIVERVRAIPYHTAPRRNLVTPFGFFGLFLSTPLAIFLATVVGGTGGGGYGEWLFSFIDLAPYGPIFGVAVGILLVFYIIVCTGALLGSLLGRLFTYVLFCRTAP